MPLLELVHRQRLRQGVRGRGREVQAVVALAGRPCHSRCRREGEQQEREQGRPMSRKR